MAGKQYNPFIGPSEPLEDRKSSSQRSINLYMAAIEGGGEDKQYVLKSAPGMYSIFTMPATIDGYCTDEIGAIFMVAGGKLYRNYNNYTAYDYLGDVGLVGGQPIQILSAGDYVFITGVPNSYVYNKTTGAVSQITDPDFPGCSTVAFLDGYWIASIAQNEQFFISAIDDPMTWDAIDFSSADSSGDRIVALATFKGELIIFGSRSTEIWVNSGDEDFPFVRYSAGSINIGIASPESFVSTGDAIYWLGSAESGANYIYEMQGHQPVRISTRAIEEDMRATGNPGYQAKLWTYQAPGNEFIGFKFFGSVSTWVFDTAIRKWHERCELSSGQYVASRVDYITANGDGFLIALGGDKVYFVASDYYYIDGDPLPRERTWPHLMRSNLEPVSYRSLELGCTTGADAPISNITLEVSNDGGYTFGPPLLRSLGAVGRRMQRVRWLMLGSSRDRVFRVRVTDPVPMTFHSATVLT
jgi:hypothetical protein